MRCLSTLNGFVGILVLSLIPLTGAPPPFSFSARRDILGIVQGTAFAYSSMAVADFNGDGRPDAAIVNFANNSVDVMLAKGNLTYSTVVYGAPGQPESIVVGDFNHDGHPDFAVAGVEALSGVDVYINQGDGTFRSPVNYPAPETLGIATADMDGDGNLDLVVKDLCCSESEMARLNRPPD